MLGGAVPFGYGQEEGETRNHPLYLQNLVFSCFLLVTRPLTQSLFSVYSDLVWSVCLNSLL
jgi:hypothetical protein